MIINRFGLGFSLLLAHVVALTEPSLPRGTCVNRYRSVSVELDTLVRYALNQIGFLGQLVVQ